MAVSCFKEALAVAKDLKDEQLETDALIEMGQVTVNADLCYW